MQLCRDVLVCILSANLLQRGVHWTNVAGMNARITPRRVDAKCVQKCREHFVRRHDCCRLVIVQAMYLSQFRDLFTFDTVESDGGLAFVLAVRLLNHIRDFDQQQIKVLLRQVVHGCLGSETRQKLPRHHGFYRQLMYYLLANGRCLSLYEKFGN